MPMEQLFNIALVMAIWRKGAVVQSEDTKMSLHQGPHANSKHLFCANTSLFKQTESWVKGSSLHHAWLENSEPLMLFQFWQLLSNSYFFNAVKSHNT